MNYRDTVNADRLLLILQTLREAADFTTNEVVLLASLAELGHRISRDMLRTDLAWLEEQGLLLAQQPSGVWVVTLTSRGYDVSLGLARVPGVARPRPA